jgi:hypothetical protein
MIRSTLLSIAATLAVSAPALAHEEAHTVIPDAVWATARILKIQVAESLPPSYEVTYVARCNDTAAQFIKFTTESETVVGVAVKRDLTGTGCAQNEPRVSKAMVRIAGAANDPANVRALRR